MEFKLARDAATRRLRLEIYLVAGIWIAGMLLAFYPGGMDLDALDMLTQGRRFAFNTWHSPIFAWILGVGTIILPGPGATFIFTLLLYATGFLFVSLYLLRAGRPIAAQLAAMGLFFPITSQAMREIGVDAFMAACCLTWFGIFLVAHGSRRQFSLIERAGLAGLLVVMIDSRYNAVFAALPLLVMATSRLNWPPRITVTRMAAGCILLAGAIGGAQLVDNVALRAVNGHPMLMLELFDIGGTTRFSGRDEAKGLLGQNFIEANRSCYQRRGWDSYMWDTCPGIGHAAEKIPPATLFHLWFRAILDAPQAYLRHRVLHFLTFTRVLCDVCGVPLTSLSWPSSNPPGSPLPHNPLGRLIDRIAIGVEVSPLGRPFLWLIELLICCGICASRAFRGVPSTAALAGMCLAASGLFFGLGFFIVGVSSPLRYALWIFVAGLLAPLFAWEVASSIWHERRTVDPAGSPPPDITQPPTAPDRSVPETAAMPGA